MGDSGEKTSLEPLQKHQKNLKLLGHTICMNGHTSTTHGTLGLEPFKEEVTDSPRTVVGKRFASSCDDWLSKRPFLSSIRANLQRHKEAGGVEVEIIRSHVADGFAMFSRSLGYQALKQYTSRTFSTSQAQAADFTHAVIGAGAVGLAVARKLAERDGTSTLLIERHGSVGTETSSRNSEVIHAGLYYGQDSLKTALCIKGKQMMYSLCDQHSIPYRNTKKWIVAQTQPQWEEITKVHNFARSMDIPTRFVGLQEALEREPDVRAKAGVLESESTGIVDSHSLMSYLEGDFVDKGGDCAFHAPVTRIESLGQNGSSGYRIYTSNTDGDGEDSVTTETLINSAGLFACAINNMILPPSRHRTPFYAKGSYYSYSASHPKPRTLIYPAPSPGHGGLGTHLTLDMTGRVRFGPDVEWVDDPTDLRPNPSRLEEAIDEIQTYLPSVKREAIDLDYSGIRPKLGKTSAVAAGKTFQDFVIQREEGFPGFVNLLGIESPGLTSCLAIGEMVKGLLYR